MTHQQGLAFGLVALTVLFFIWGRWRYDLVALCALAAGVAIGLVPAKQAFAGFSNDIVIIIASALVLSAAVSRSGVIELLLSPLLPRLKTERSQVPLLSGLTAVLSMATKNVGALTLLMPSALQIAKRTGVPPGRLLMPMSFGSLVGGLAVLVGTSPNIIVSEVRAEALGQPYHMFDFMPVGGLLTIIAVAYLAFAYRLLPKNRQPAVNVEQALGASPYMIEAQTPEDWSLGRSRVGDLTALAKGEVTVAAILSGKRRRNRPHPNCKIAPGDILMLEGEQAALDTLVANAKLKLTDAERPLLREGAEELRTIEAVIDTGSDLVGRTAGELELNRNFGVNLLAVGRTGSRLRGRMSAIRFKAGDLVVLQGSESALPQALQTLDCLPLAEREVRMGDRRKIITPVLILAAAMAAVGLGLLPVASAFFIAAVLVVVTGALTMRQAYAALEPPVLVLVAALIPVSDTIQNTGGADLIARGLSTMFDGLPPLVTLTAMMAASMAATPFLNNAATVLIVAPIGMGLARQLGFSPDPFLMAVAVGAGCDFLTPVGHQCNTLVLGPGGYKFGDYARLGAPLTVLILAIAPFLITLFWPFAR